MKDQLDTEEIAGLWKAIRALMRDRRAKGQDGPHSVADLARRMGVSRPRVQSRMTREPGPLAMRGPWPSVEALVRAFEPRPGAPVTAAGLLASARTGPSSVER